MPLADPNAAIGLSPTAPQTPLIGQAFPPLYSLMNDAAPVPSADSGGINRQPYNPRAIYPMRCSPAENYWAPFAVANSMCPQAITTNMFSQTQAGLPLPGTNMPQLPPPKAVLNWYQFAKPLQSVFNVVVESTQFDGEFC